MRGRAGSIDNLGGYALIDPEHNLIVEGSRFSLSPEQMLKLCKEPVQPQGETKGG
jgi:hypothetical protein